VLVWEEPGVQNKYNVVIREEGIRGLDRLLKGTKDRNIWVERCKKITSDGYPSGRKGTAAFTNCYILSSWDLKYRKVQQPPMGGAFQSSSANEDQGKVLRVNKIYSRTL